MPIFGPDEKCAVCLRRPKEEPVILFCGHNFCFVCLQGVFDRPKPVHRCPECRDEIRENQYWMLGGPRDGLQAHLI